VFCKMIFSNKFGFILETFFSYSFTKKFYCTMLWCQWSILPNHPTQKQSLSIFHRNIQISLKTKKNLFYSLQDFNLQPRARILKTLWKRFWQSYRSFITIFCFKFSDKIFRIILFKECFVNTNLCYKNIIKNHSYYFCE